MNDPSTKSVRHPVKSGETLAGIARQLGVTLEALLAANPEIQDPDQRYYIEYPRGYMLVK